MSGRTMVVVAVAAACHGRGPRQPVDDCAIVAQDPAHAKERVTANHPGDATAVAAAIEACIAPVGADECERLVKIWRAIPTMMSSDVALPADADALAACRGMPPEMRHCMLPSYGIGHPTECARIRQIIVDSAARTAQEELSQPIPRARDCPVPFVAVAPSGMSVELRGSAEPVGDFDELMAALRRIKQGEAECTDLDLLGERGVPYRQVIEAMDIAVKVGFVDVALVGSAADQRRTVQWSQTPRPDVDALLRPDLGSARDPFAPVPLPPRRDLSHVPVIILSRTELRVGSAFAATVADALVGSGDLGALVHALPPPPSRGPATVVLQADKDTDASLINRIVETCEHAGYDNILFAVKNK